MSCSAIILCGGRGTRVGGKDKGLLHYGDSTLVELALASISAQAGDIVISANRNRARYERLGYPVVNDGLSGFQGPLAGLHATLPLCAHEQVLVVPCDMPRLPHNLADRLLPPLQNCDLSYAWDGEREQYLVAAMHRQLSQSLSDYLSGGERSVRGWYSGLRSVQVDFSDQPESFVNINQLPEH
jgi:molybdenum cofactor guanylyltransferase